MARIFLSPGETFGPVGAGSNQLFGTNENETISIAANGDVVLDASFNRGGDTINIAGDAGDYVASISGSFLVLTSTTGASAGADIRVPIGVGMGTEITFGDASAPRVLVATGGTVTLGNQVIPLTGTTDVAPGNSLDVGSLDNPAYLDATFDSIDFIDDFTVRTNVVLEGFTDDDSIAVDNLASLNTFTFAAGAVDGSAGNNDLLITAGSGANINNITILDVIDSPLSGSNYAAAMAAVGFNFLSLG